MANEFPAYGQMRASNELRKAGTLVSGGGVRSIWLRHGLETFKKRLKALEERAAAEGIVYTEAQLCALEASKRSRESHPDEIETQHPGYLVSPDTVYVGYLKGVGRITQQTAIDTFSSLGFAKLYTAKIPVTAADLLNDQVLPFFEKEGVPVLRVLTDRGTEYCGAPDQHPSQLFLQLNDIEHTKTKVKSPQTNGICRQLHQTMLNEFYRIAFHQEFLRHRDAPRGPQIVMDRYKQPKNHQGKRCLGRTPIATFIEGKKLYDEKNWDESFGMSCHLTIPRGNLAQCQIKFSSGHLTSGSPGGPGAWTMVAPPPITFTLLE